MTWRSRRVMRVALGKRDPLRANPAGRTPDAALPIHQGHPMLGPRQVISRPLLGIPYAPRPASTFGTFVAPDAVALNPDPHPRARSVRFPLDSVNAKPLKIQNPSTLAWRSHMSSLLCGNTERTSSDCSMASGIAFSLEVLNDSVESVLQARCPVR
jgi:hypothetical protein